MNTILFYLLKSGVILRKASNRYNFLFYSSYDCDLSVPINLVINTDKINIEKYVGFVIK